MELREIRSFITLAEQLHFGRAARLLNLSQPALSKQILRLEEELGGTLLVRDRHGTKLTSFGSRFLQAPAPSCGKAMNSSRTPGARPKVRPAVCA